jgi:general stress protein 26
MVMNNRDTSDESAKEKKARDVAAKLDEASATFAGTSNMESHARVGYTERKVESRAQNAADEEGVTLHRNPDGSHTAVDESRAAGVTPMSGTGSTANAAFASDDTEGGSTRGTDSRQADGSNATTELGRADVVKILRSADTVMLATALADGKILAHPMALQEVTEDADVWFFLALDGDQANALRTNPEVNLSIAEAGNWLSVAGRAEFVDDRAKIESLWSDSAEAWFDDSRDPNLGLIKVVTHSAQHWGLPGGRASGLFRMVKSKITGDRPGGGTQTTEL